MTRFYVATLMVVAIISPALSQHIDDTYRPVIKETPLDLKIVQHTDNNYLLYGDFNYAGSEESGSLVKVDVTGKPVASFNKLYTNQFIDHVFVMASGKMLVHGGFTYVNGNPSSNLLRLNADGSVDDTFQLAAEDKYSSFVVQSTGKIVTAFQGGLRRLNEDGSVDESFVGSSASYSELLLANEDKIYARDFLSLYRLMPDGSLDKTFSYETKQSLFIDHFTRQTDDKLIAVMVDAATGDQIRKLVRFNTDGSIDDSFVPNLLNQQISNCIARQNGKIAVTGLFTIFNPISYSAIELNEDGSANRSLLYTDFNYINAIYEDKQHNIFVSGEYRAANDNENVKYLAKIDEDYSLDAAFQVDIYCTPRLNQSIPLAIQSDGKLLVGGTYSSAGTWDSNQKLSRLLADGNYDPSFAPAIRNKISNGFTTSVQAIAVQPDNRIVVGGFNVFDGGSPTLGRLLPNGQIDYSFNLGTGLVNSDHPGMVRFILLRDSKIYVFGFFESFNGAPCQSFVILDESGNMVGPQVHSLTTNSVIYDVAFQSDGKIVLMGELKLGPDDKRTFIRLNPDGSIDNSFQLRNVDGGAGSLEIDSHDNIFIAGNYIDNDQKKILKKFDRDGVAIPSFDTGVSFSSNDFLIAYFVKSLKNDMLAVGGIFQSYNGKEASTIVIIDKDGAQVPMANPYDSHSVPSVAAYRDNELFVLGRFSDKGQLMSSAAKVILPEHQLVYNYQVTDKSDSTMLLSWSGYFEDADHIVVEQSSPDASEFKVLATIDVTSRSFKPKDLNEATPYSFRIKGVSTSFTSPYVTTSDTTDIKAQVALPAGDVAPTSFVANWKYIAGTDSCLLQVSNDQFKSLLHGYENRIVKGGSLTVEHPDDDKSYAYRVKRFKNKKASDFSATVTVNNITAIEEGYFLPISVYPNPVVDQLFVELPGDGSNAKVYVSNMSGQPVAEYAVTEGQRSAISVDNLPAGMFIVTVTSQGKSRRFKLIRRVE